MTRLGVWYDFRNPARWRVPWPQLYRETLDQAAHAEQLGFSSIWLSEHHFSEEGYLPVADGHAGRAGPADLPGPAGHRGAARPAAPPAAAGRGLRGDRPAVRRPARRRAGPRLQAGRVRSARRAQERARRAHRRDHRDPAAGLARRAVLLRRAALPVRDVVIAPPPVQQPGPPIWVGGNSLAAARRAARHGVCFMPDSGAGPGTLRRVPVRAARRAGPPRLATNRVLFAAASREEAWEICGPHFLYQFNAYRQWFSGGRRRRHARRRADRSVGAVARALLRRHARTTSWPRSRKASSGSATRNWSSGPARPGCRSSRPRRRWSSSPSTCCRPWVR